MKIFDTRSRKKVVLSPVRDHQIRIYLCGPTVYDYGHLGHGRSAIAFDLLRRYLKYRGYEIVFVRNWTDIDDKTIGRAHSEGISVKELTEKFIKIYKEDFEKLNILPPDYDPKPTDHIPEIIDIVKRLFDGGHAYMLDDGVYFDIATFPRYGELSKQRLDELKSGARVSVSGEKRNPGDFVLWKFEKPGDPSWESPWGKGRPGWHIECTAMSIKYLGAEFDIHCGGQDLVFPHHEDEIAQAKSAGYQYARHWMHNGFVNIDNEKMSKSLGNFFTLREVFRTFSPLAVRFFLLSTHYRAPLNFSEDTLRQADATLKHYNDFIMRMTEIAHSTREGKEKSSTVDRIIQRAREGFESGLDDDLNISKSLAALSELVHEINTRVKEKGFGQEDAQKVLAFFKNVDTVLGVFSFEKEMIAEDIETMINEREAARESRDYRKADRIRNNLLELGIALEDTKEGTRWKKV
jgi:cysteinyl-tRNA synthetase